MTPEQLASARVAHWHEDSWPLLTLDDARTWLQQMQLCLYLPRKTHILAPAPSFVSAVLGQSSPTPPPEAIQQAHEFLVRLVTEGTVVPLNLFGTPGEQPDFLIVTSALPHLAALQPDRNWKKAPARSGPGRVSPLAIEIWKLLEREGALTASEIRGHLGHELTEAATIRGLSELWQNLRVGPLPQSEGQAAHWQILSVTHKKEMATGGTMAQATALSLLVSYYVQSVLTATAEDIEAFLSPVASRSRIRDVIRGLSATRQLRTLSMDAQTFLFIEGTLPDMPELPAAETPEAAKPAFMGRSAYRERMLHKANDEDAAPKEDTSPSTYKDRRGESGPGSAPPRRRPFSDRPRTGPSRRDSGKPADRTSRFAAGGSSSRPARPSFGDRARGASSDRPPFPGKPAGGGARPFRPRTEGDRPRSGPPRPAGRPDRPFHKPAGEGRPFIPREGSSRPPYRGKPADGGARPFRPRAEGDRPRSGSPRPAGRPDRPFRKPGGEGRPFTPRPFTPREGGSSRPPLRGKPAEGGTRPFRPRSAADRSGGTSRPPRATGKFVKRDGAPSPGRTAGRPPARPGARPGALPGARPGARPGVRPGTPGRNPGGTGRPKFGPPRSGPPRPGAGKPGGPRPSGRSSNQRPSSPRPGGLRPPTRKPRKPENESE